MKNKISVGMNKYTNKIYKSVLFILLAVVVGISAVYATEFITNTLTPNVAPQKTMKSLSDLYTLVNTGVEPSTPSSVYQAPTGTPTITENSPSILNIYNKTKDEITKLSSRLSAGEETVFGLTGNVNIVNTSSGDATTNDIMLGKKAWVDGAEVTGVATSGPAPLTWQTDPALNLCWSTGQYETDNGCSVGGGWIDASVAQDGSLPLGAVEYCQYLNTNGTTLATTPQNIWHLPTITEYQSITDFTTFNNATQVPGFAADSIYWSSSEYADYTDYAWFWSTYNGGINYNDKDNQYPVRCAR